MVTCFCKPSVMSTSERKHLTHILAAFGAMGIPHLQQSTLQQSGELEKYLYLEPLLLNVTQKQIVSIYFTVALRSHNDMRGVGNALITNKQEHELKTLHILLFLSLFGAKEICDLNNYKFQTKNTQHNSKE